MACPVRGAGDHRRPGWVSVAGPPRADVAGLLPGVTVVDTGIADADVTLLYQVARAALADRDRLVPVASALNEASRIFHEPAVSRHPNR